MPGPAHDALIAYIENALGQTLEEAYPDEWEAALSGEEPTFQIDTGDDLVELTLVNCTGAPGSDYEVSLPGRRTFDITSKSHSHPDNALAWTTGHQIGGGYSTQIAGSTGVHLAQGQSAYIVSSQPYRRNHDTPQETTGFTYKVLGEAKAWRKNPRRLVNISELSLTVPSAPNFSNRIRAAISWSTSHPNHGEWGDFYDGANGINRIYSQMPPPVAFGVLVRGDESLNHPTSPAPPLTEWWWNPSGFSTAGPRDSQFRATTRTGLGTRNVPSLSAPSDSEFDDLRDEMADSLASFNNPAPQTVTLSTSASTFNAKGWAAMWWVYPTEDSYFRSPASGLIADEDPENPGEYFDANLYRPWPADGDDGIPSLPNVLHATGGGTFTHWSDLTIDGLLTDMRAAGILPTGPANETVTALYNPSAPTPTHGRPAILARGPWVRIDPGNPPDNACITDVRCIVPQRS
jgi:hypothetical protein